MLRPLFVVLGAMLGWHALTTDQGAALPPPRPDARLLGVAAVAQQAMDPYEEQVFAAADRLLLLLLDRSLTAWREPRPGTPAVDGAPRREGDRWFLIYYLGQAYRLLHPGVEVPLSFDATVRAQTYAWMQERSNGAGALSHLYGVRHGEVLWGDDAPPRRRLAELLLWCDHHALDPAVAEQRVALATLSRWLRQDDDVAEATQRFMELASLMNRLPPADSLEAAAVAEGFPAAGETRAFRLLGSYDPPIRLLRRTTVHPALGDRRRLTTDDFRALLAAHDDISGVMALFDSRQQSEEEIRHAARQLGAYYGHAGPFLGALLDAVEAAGLPDDDPAVVAALALAFSPADDSLPHDGGMTASVRMDPDDPWWAILTPALTALADQNVPLPECLRPDDAGTIRVFLPTMSAIPGGGGPAVLARLPLTSIRGSAGFSYIEAEVSWMPDPRDQTREKGLLFVRHRETP